MKKSVRILKLDQQDAARRREVRDLTPEQRLDRMWRLMDQTARSTKIRRVVRIRDVPVQ